MSEAADPQDGPAATPLLTVVQGQPDPGELAAVVAVLLAGAGAAAATPRRSGTHPEGLWGAPETLLRRGGPHPGGWGGPSATLRG